MDTFTLTVIGYMDSFPKRSGMDLAEVREVLFAQRELTPMRIRQAIAWTENAGSGESWKTYTDLLESDQADIYLTKD